MGNNQAANKRFDQAMKACGISDKNDRHLLIREHFHDYLADSYSAEKDQMEYKDLLEVAKIFIQENYPDE